MKKILFFFIVFFVVLGAKAQNIIGKVLEISKDGVSLPIYRANVYWEGTTIGVVSDADGKFSIVSPPSLPATLNVSYVGYVLDSKEVINNEYIFYLKQSIDLKEVEIEGEQSTTTFSIISPLNIQNISSGEILKAACCNLSECFETNATVDVTYSDAVSGLKTIQMLGLSGSYVKINNESMIFADGLLNSYGLSYVPGSWIESIQITKGSGSVINGLQAFTGQINIEYFKADNKDADRVFWNMYVNSEGKIENNLLLAKKEGDWKSNLFTHISYLGHEIDHYGGDHDHDHSSHPTHSGDGFLDVPKQMQFNFLNRWKYTGSDRFKYQFNVKGLLEDRVGGQKEEYAERYLVDIHNNFLELNTKSGYIFSNTDHSIGLQTVSRIHNQEANFGNNFYSGKQEKINLNLMYKFIHNNNNVICGFSYAADRFSENFQGNINRFLDDVRVDLISGVFGEYNYKVGENFIVNTGFRTDYYNIEDNFYHTPRLNIKYNLSDQTVIRFSAGKGFRVPNVLVDNLFHLASSRDVIVSENIKPEIGLNYGTNFSYCFYLFSNEGTLNIDFYRTVFDNQIVVDLEDQSKLEFYNLDGDAYANSIQFDLMYSPFTRFHIKTSYKIDKSYSTYDGELKSTPLKPHSRALLNVSYATKLDYWKFDFTANYIGKSRIPNHSEITMVNNMSDPFTVCNTQVTRKIGGFDLYLGVENIFSSVQDSPIIAAENPFSEEFDASLIYAPVMGRLIYAGLRYRF